MEPTAASGWLDTGNQLLGQQASQLQMALQHADQIMKQRQVEHQQAMDAWTQSPDNPINRYHSALAEAAKQNANTTEEYRKSSEERQKAEDEAQKQERALNLGQKFSSTTPTQGELLAIMKGAGASQETIDSILKAGLSGLQSQKRAEWETQPEPAPTQQPRPQYPPLPGTQGMGPQMPPQEAMGPPVQQGQGVPPQAIQALMGGAMGGMQMPQMPQGAPMPQQPQMPPQQALGPMQAMPGPGSGFPGAPELPPIMQQGQKPEFMPPTEQDFLSSAPAAYQMNMEAKKEALQLQKTREDVMKRQIALKEDMDPAKFQEKVANDIAREDIYRQRVAGENKMFDSRIKDLKQKITRMDQNFVERTKLDDSLIKYRTDMSAAASKNAASRAQSVTAGNRAKGEWMRMIGLTSSAENDAVKMENMETQAEDAYTKSALALRTAEGMSITNPSPATIGDFQVKQAEFMQKRDQFVRIKKTAHQARVNADSLKNLSGTMQKEVQEAGLLGNETPEIKVPRMPARPKNPVDEAAKALGIP